MTKAEAIKMIDDHKNETVDPTEIIHWAWLRIILNQISDKDWERYVERATEVLSR